MLKIAFAFVSVALILAICHATAAGADSSSLVLQGPNPVTAVCPMKLTFNGSITGPANSSVTYLWARYVNGKSSDSAPTTTTIPGNGTLKLPSQQLTVDATTAGFQSYTLFITVPANSNNGVVYFTAKCTTGLNPNVINQANPSKAGLKLPQGVINQVYIAPPNGAKTTNNEQECGSHGAGFNCPIAFSNQWLVLVWCWGPNSCGPASTDQHIDKFNIYEVDGGKRVYVKSTNADQSGNLASAGFVQPPNAGFSNQCYAVTAVYGKNESVLSNPVCLGNGTIGNIDETFHASASMTQGKSHAYNQSTFPLSSGECAPGPQCLGWYHDEGSIVAPNIIPLWYWDDVFRTYYLFDLSSIAGHYIASATLRVPVTGGSLNCFLSLAAANAHWDPNTTDFTAWIGGDFGPPGDSIGNPIDVTDIVRKWASGSPNYGFVLRGSNETFNADASRCITMLGTDATLEITHS